MEQVNLSFKVPSETVEKIRTGESIPYLESRNQSGQITSAYPASDIDPSAESRSEKWSQMAQAVASGAKENPLKTATGLFAAGATISAFVYGWHKFESWRQRRAHENRGVRQLEQAPKALPLGSSAESEILHRALLTWMNAAENSMVTVSTVNELEDAWENYADAYHSEHGENPSLDSDIVGLIDRYSDVYRRNHELSSSLAPKSNGDIAVALETQKKLLKRYE
ncbi:MULTISPECIES: hypothetical protein [Corynebacterium]|uniref:Uncharacterized protein n=2 Tax=Corynebacterium TaxID=1716 RepID=A0A2N6T725_9CORY|nr:MULTISPECIES: hypothetical protein [Corynebacterium]MCZ9293050.1 hypothetical protein [Corynebacterium meitnerae]PMC65125.1 hypothetical protein CJ203_01500 [Corynebacterium tuscaniense]